MNQPAAKKVVEYIPDPNKFDLRTHVWDGQGKLTRKNTYRMFNIDGRVVYERPVNSGNLWGENNQPAGRVLLEFAKDKPGVIAKKTFDFEAEHVEFTPPLTGAEALHFELEQKNRENEQLRAELAQIKGDKQPLKAVQEGFPADDKSGQNQRRK